MDQRLWECSGYTTERLGDIHHTRDEPRGGAIPVSFQRMPEAHGNPNAALVSSSPNLSLREMSKCETDKKLRVHEAG